MRQRLVRHEQADMAARQSLRLDLVLRHTQTLGRIMDLDQRRDVDI